MDEQPVQLLKEARRPIPATKRHARRIDYEYERAGTASIFTFTDFMFTEPLAHLARGDGACFQDQSGLGGGSGPLVGRPLPQMFPRDLGVR
ncbi:MAG: hypothetical protein WD875_03870 [Pirellulales bacterium]